MTIQNEEEQQKQREGRILFAIFGSLIALLIGLMWYIDYYMESNDPLSSIHAKSADD